MEGRLTPNLLLTKPDVPRTVYERAINTDLDLIDAGYGALDARVDAIEAGGGGGPGGTEVGALEFTLGDGVATITTAEPVQWVEVPFDCTITGATLTADAVGSVVVDVQVSDYATYPPDGADTVCGAAKPTLAAAIKSADVALTGWDTSLTRGHYLRVVVVSAATVKRVVLSLAIEGV